MSKENQRLGLLQRINRTKASLIAAASLTIAIATVPYWGPTVNDWVHGPGFNDRLNGTTSSEITTTAQKFNEHAPTPQDIAIATEQAVEEALENEVIKPSEDFNEEATSISVATQVIDEAITEALQVSQQLPAYPHNFRDVAAFVIVDLEGDDQVADEPGGGIAKFGINSLAHPEIDVANITRDEAYQISDDDYWTPINADSMPPHFRLAAFDTVFNHGLTGGKRLIALAEDDPEKLLLIRLDEYDRLARENPEEYAEFLPGWYARIENLANNMGIELSSARLSLSEQAPKVSLRPQERTARPQLFTLAKN